ncbi:MAG: thiamine biosynthesis protein ApbE, partial [Flavobacterium psychrophilum]
MQEFSRSLKLMGNNFTITVVASGQSDAEAFIDMAVDEIKRIEKQLTTFSNESQTSIINEFAGVAPVKVDREVFELIQRSIGISHITQGAFDITYGSIDKTLWNFDKTMEALPSKENALRMVHLIDYRNIELDAQNCTVFLKNKGMRIGFGGIGKGYAAEMAKKLLIQKGVSSGIVNASGDLTAWGA